MHSLSLAGPTIGDQPRAVVPPGIHQAQNPAILVDHHYGHTFRLHGSRYLIDVRVIKQARRCPSPSSQIDIGGHCELPDVYLLACAVGVLGDEFHVQDVNDSLVGQREQLLKTRRSEPTVGKLDGKEIDRSQIVVS